MHLEASWLLRIFFLPAVSSAAKYRAPHSWRDSWEHSVLRCVAVCCGVLQSVEFKNIEHPSLDETPGNTVCCGVLQCVTVSCIQEYRAPHSWRDPWKQSVLRCVAVCCSELHSRISSTPVLTRSLATQCVAVCCSVLQCVAVRCIQRFRAHQSWRDPWQSFSKVNPTEFLYQTFSRGLTFENFYIQRERETDRPVQLLTLLHTMQHTATHCNTQYNTHRNMLQSCAMCVCVRERTQEQASERASERESARKKEWQTCAASQCCRAAPCVCMWECCRVLQCCRAAPCVCVCESECKSKRASERGSERGKERVTDLCSFSVLQCCAMFAWYKFSIVSSLLYLVYQISICTHT